PARRRLRGRAHRGHGARHALRRGRPARAGGGRAHRRRNPARGRHDPRGRLRHRAAAVRSGAPHEHLLGGRAARRRPRRVRHLDDLRHRRVPRGDRPRARRAAQSRRGGRPPGEAAGPHGGGCAMTVSLVLVVIMAVLFACGVYSMLERSLTRVLIGFLLLGNAANLLLLIVIGAPGLAPCTGAASPGDMSDPMPMALTLTAIVITFAVSAFLLALIYRSWQLGQADTVQDDVEDVALRERTVEEDEVMDDEDDTEHDDATTDFVGTETSPIMIVRERDESAEQDGGER